MKRSEQNENASMDIEAVALQDLEIPQVDQCMPAR